MESVFVVGSILLALAVDEWAQDQEYAELADQSLGIFEREILQNRARIDDAIPYHTGIRDFLGGMRVETSSPTDVASIMEGLTPPVLLNTAWETALATGALTHMEFEVVSALSLTYSIQETFADRARVDRPRLSPSDAMSPADGRARVEEAYEYVAALVRDEAELLTVYDQALELIALHRDPDHQDPARDSPAPSATSSSGEP
ncbi:MAG: hypothetical protein R3253_10955 [Longimicrobiales bacterium]|nr:hypothetical protein [Longimicrobiales bacterium]